MAIDPVKSGGAPASLATIFSPSNRPATNTASANTAAPATGSVALGSTGTSQVASPLLTSAVSATGQTQAPSATRTEVEDAVSKVQKVVAAQASNLLFSIDEDSGRTLVKVVDSTTHETIRQIPSEEILSIAKALDKLQGLLLKQTA